MGAEDDKENETDTLSGIQPKVALAAMAGEKTLAELGKKTLNEVYALMLPTVKMVANESAENPFKKRRMLFKRVWLALFHIPNTQIDRFHMRFC